MALVLSMRLEEDFFVGDERFVVAEIKSDSHVRVKHGEKLLDLYTSRATPVLPNVRLSVADRGQLGLARIAIEAPKSVTILRGGNYRKLSGQ